MTAMLVVWCTLRVVRKR